jgi:translation initiation factor IF-2
MTEWLEEEAKKRTPKTSVEEVSGKIKVLKIFSQQKTMWVLGGKVLEGVIETGSTVRIIRKDNVVGTGKVVELQSQKIKTNIVKEGTEFGARIDSAIDIAQNDVLEPFTMVTK